MEVWSYQWWRGSYFKVVSFIPVITWHAPDTSHYLLPCHASSTRSRSRARNTMNEDCINQSLIKILKQTLMLLFSSWWWTGRCGNFCQLRILFRSSVSNWGFNGKQRKQIKWSLFFSSSFIFLVFGSVIKRFYQQSRSNDDSGLPPSINIQPHITRIN